MSYSSQASEASAHNVMGAAFPIHTRFSLANLQMQSHKIIRRIIYQRNWMIERIYLDLDSFAMLLPQNFLQLNKKFWIFIAHPCAMALLTLSLAFHCAARFPLFFSHDILKLLSGKCVVLGLGTFLLRNRQIKGKPKRWVFTSLSRSDQIIIVV